MILKRVAFTEDQDDLALPDKENFHAKLDEIWDIVVPPYEYGSDYDSQMGSDFLDFLDFGNGGDGEPGDNESDGEEDNDEPEWEL